MRHAEVLTLSVRLQQVGVEVPAPMARYIELHEVATALATETPSTVLGLSDLDAREWIREQSIRTHTQGLGGSGYSAGTEAFRNALAAELHGDCFPFVEGIIVGLQPRFESASAPLVAAARTFGFTKTTTAQTVLDMNDAAAIDAWRAVAPAIKAITPIVELRKLLSLTFDESPTADDMGVPATSPHNIDFSVCFAEGGNWSLDGTYYDGDWKRGKGLGSIDWFALALGGLRLNTFDDVDAKVQPNRYAVRLLAAQRQDDLEHAELEA